VSYYSYGQVEKDNITDNILVEIDELIVDQTLSKSGRDFYEIFYKAWEWPKTSNSFTIYIKERPARANSTQVQIYLDELLVFESFLQPRYDALLELTSYANVYVKNQILAYEEVLKQLQGDDMSGTGIY
jgi:curli production assembly/transport component CsgE